MFRPFWVVSDLSSLISLIRVSFICFFSLNSGNISSLSAIDAFGSENADLSSALMQGYILFTKNYCCCVKYWIIGWFSLIRCTSSNVFFLRVFFSSHCSKEPLTRRERRGDSLGAADQSSSANQIFGHHSYSRNVPVIVTDTKEEPRNTNPTGKSPILRRIFPLKHSATQSSHSARASNISSSKYISIRLSHPSSTTPNPPACPRFTKVLTFVYLLNLLTFLALLACSHVWILIH